MTTSPKGPYVALERRDSRRLALSLWLVGSVMAAYGAIAGWVECPRPVQWIIWQPPPPVVAAAYVALGLGGVTVMSAAAMVSLRRRRYLPRLGALVSALLSGAGAAVAVVAVTAARAQATYAYGYDGFDVIPAHLTEAPWMLLGGLVEASIGAAWFWRIAVARSRSRI